MGIHSHCQSFFFLSLLFAVSLCSADEKTFEVVGTTECADCSQNNLKTSQAFSGLHVTIDCKLKNGDTKRLGGGEVDEQGKFKVSLPQELKEECYAQLHSAAALPCPAHNGLEASKIVLKSKTNGKTTFAPTKNLQFSTALCSSKTFWPYLKHPPLPPHPWLKHFPKPTLPPFGHPLPPLPPLIKPKPPVPVYKPPVAKPLPPPVPVYKPEPKPKPPVVIKPLPPPVPIYKPKPKPPVVKPQPKPPVYIKPKPPVVKPLPKPPVYKPKPKPPVVKKPCPPIVKPLPPPVPIYKPKPLPPPVPVYKPPVVVKPLPPPVPVYKPPVVVKPLPPPVPIYKPPVVVPPITKKPCPPLPSLPPLPKLPPKYFHHPKFGHFPPLPPSIPHP